MLVTTCSSPTHTQVVEQCQQLVCFTMNAHIFSTSYIPSETTYEDTQFPHWAIHMYLLLYVYYWRCIHTNYQRQHDLLCNTYVWYWRAYCWALLPLTDNTSTYIYLQTQESWSVVSHTYVPWCTYVYIKLVFAPLEILISQDCGEERTKLLLLCPDTDRWQAYPHLRQLKVFLPMCTRHYGPLQTTYNYVIHWLMSHQVWCGIPWCLQVFAPPDHPWPACHGFLPSLCALAVSWPVTRAHPHLQQPKRSHQMHQALGLVYA